MANAKSKNKSEEKESKPPARLSAIKTLSDISTNKSSQSEDAQGGVIDLVNIREFLIQKAEYYQKLIKSLLNLELKSTGKIFSSSSLLEKELHLIITQEEIKKWKEKNEQPLFPATDRDCQERIDANIKRISKLMSVFSPSSDASYELVWRCCVHMYTSYLFLQSIPKISSHTFFLITFLDQATIGCAFQLLGYSQGNRLISGEELKKFHSLRTYKSTITKRRKHENHKGCVKTSAIKMFNQFTLSTVKNNISEAAFVNMIKDDLSPLKMSEKKIKNLLHELQDEGQIKFDPRKAKSGKMIHFSNNGKDVT